MRRIRTASRMGPAIAALFLFMGMGGCGPSDPGDLPASPASSQTAPPTEQLNAWIGQMLMVGFRGTRLEEDDPFLVQLRDLHLGGTVLFDYDVASQSRLRNIQDADQVRGLSRQLRAAAGRPLLIAIDQEGGRIARLKPRHGFPPTLSQQELAQLDEEERTRTQARQVAGLLSELGINVNFAPVLDLNLHTENPIIGALQRSYSADPEVVVRHARWTIEEFHKQGVLAAVKHFPGHGSSRQDSHLGLPDVTSHWSQEELTPFARLIEESLPDMVMTAHLFNARWDEERPATLSPKVIQGILRQRLGFQGVVVSDDLQMGAISQRYGLEETLLKAVQAGVDILVLANNTPDGYDPQIAAKAHAALRRLVDEGKLTPERLRLSAERIQRLHRKLGHN
ncbi:MAG TPA: glycoside hydrolase family 3 N-terminal domain-containing protein [Acidobacteriota bacterium]|nr:glycoside hydrolase family 3 N-terminal domain-containing protein [Acidobacteriota bacterium]